MRLSVALIAGSLAWTFCAKLGNVACPARKSAVIRCSRVMRPPFWLAALRLPFRRCILQLCRSRTYEAYVALKNIQLKPPPQSSLGLLARIGKLDHLLRGMETQPRRHLLCCSFLFVVRNYSLKNPLFLGGVLNTELLSRFFQLFGKFSVFDAQDQRVQAWEIAHEIPLFQACHHH